MTPTSCPALNVVPSSTSKVSIFPVASAETITSVASKVPVASYFGMPLPQAVKKAEPEII